MFLPGATNHASVSFWSTVDSGLKYMRPNPNKSAQHVEIYDKSESKCCENKYVSVKLVENDINVFILFLFTLCALSFETSNFP